MDLNLLRAAIVAYLVATATCALELLAPRPRLRRVGINALRAGAMFHASALFARLLSTGHFPITNFSDSLSALAFLVVCAFLCLEVRWPIGSLAVVIAPLAFTGTLGAHAFYRGQAAMPVHLQSALLPVHVMLAVLGNALFSLAFAVSLAYLVQERRLKAKRVAGRMQLPALETLDQLNHRFLTWGLSLFTLAIASGVVWAHLVWGRFWSNEPRLVWAMVTWVVYAIVFQGRVTAGMRGRRAATLTIVGFATLVCSLIGVNFFTPGRHGGTFG
jgi:cytochrome c-type biogenesis protein CcsB